MINDKQNPLLRFTISNRMPYINKYTYKEHYCSSNFTHNNIFIIILILNFNINWYNNAYVVSTINEIKIS